MIQFAQTFGILAGRTQYLCVIGTAVPLRDTTVSPFNIIVTVTVTYRGVRLEPLGAARLEAPRLQYIYSTVGCRK